MTRRWLWFAVGAWLVCLWPAAAQKGNPLGSQPQHFYDALPSYLVSDPNLKSETAEMLKTWVGEYQSYYSSLGEKEREEVAEIARLTYKCHLPAYPDLYNFLQTQRELRTRQPASNRPWSAALKNLLKKNQGRRFNTLVNSTYNLLLYGRLYKSASAHWRIDAEDFYFEQNKDASCFVFNRAYLVCGDASDSIEIHGASGRFYPLDDRWDGTGGKCYWQRVKLDPDSCYTELGSYTVNLKQSRIEGGKVLHYNLYLYPEPLHGEFSDRVVTGNPLIQDRYPQFRSNSVLYFTDMFPDVDIRGTLVQEGVRQSFGSEKNAAVMTVKEEDRPRATVTSARFLAERGRISATDAKLVMHLENDSMYNSTVSVRYNNQNRSLTASLSASSGLKVPFINTYHGLRMEFESMRWYLDLRKVEMGLFEMPGRVGSISFKSLNIFSRDELGIITRGTEDNSLFLLARLSKQYNDPVLSLNEVADMLNVSPVQALAMLKDMITYGYVSYDPIRKKVTVLPQLRQLLDVTASKADFDEIEFKTTEDGRVKAVMRLDSLDIFIKGVPYVLLSGKQDVYAMPYDSTVHVLKGTDFHFDGLFHVGKFNFRARGARFYYDKFQVDIADVQRMGLEISVYEDGEVKRHPVESVIEALSGTVYIDNPANKGGRKNYPEYPIFESYQPSYVYYNMSYIQNGAYTADSFYFKVDPFKLEKLATIEMDSIRFMGTLMTHGIFPDIREWLRVRPDRSLGISTVSPAGGWPAYRGKSNYTGKLFLDKGGLYGEGNYSYLTAEVSSLRMVFLPKKMYYQTGDISVEERTLHGVCYPHMQARGVQAEYLRDGDCLSVKSVKDSLLHFFKEDWLMRGTYTVSPGKSYAKGELRYREGYSPESFCIASPHFNIACRAFTADSGGFKIVSGSVNLAGSEGMNIGVDLNTASGRFVALDGRSPVSFGANRYDGRLSFMTWDMERKTLSMRHGTAADASAWAALDSLPKGDWFDYDMPGETFTSTRRAQAGLHFNAVNSVFFYGDTVLKFDGVKRLLTADAMLVPALGKLTVNKTGQVENLYAAELYFGDRTRLHSFHNVTATVHSAEQYRASGLFDYKAPGLEVQSVMFNGIRPLGEGYSQASARITYDSGTVALNPGFEFIGKIELSARETYPFFAGSVRMTYGCDVREAAKDNEEYYDEADNRMERLSDEDMEDMEHDSPRLRRGKKQSEDEAAPSEEVIGLSSDNPFLSGGIQFRSYINSDSVCIPVDASTRSTTGRLLGCGFYTQMRSRQIRYLFMERKITTDVPNVSAAGFLQFSSARKSYFITDSAGVERFSLNLNDCDASVYGDIDPVFNTYELKTSFFGDMVRSGEGGTVSVDGMGLFDFYLTAEVQKRLALLMNRNQQSTGRMNGGLNENVDGYLKQHLPQKEYNRVMADARVLGVLNRIPAVLNQSLVLSDMEMVWDADRKQFRTLPDASAQVLSVGGNAVNKTFSLTASMRKTRKGDVVDIYLEAGEKLWIYFSYTNHYMQIITSDEAFNDFLGSMKSKHRKQGRYEFFLSTLSKRDSYLKRL